jgi:hypothetical protein
VINRRKFFLVLGAALNLVARAEPPPALVRALEHLRAQKSYSWEMINLDPGPVAQRFEGRNGVVTTVLVNTTPDIKGTLDFNGDVLLQRQWADGLKLDTFITRDGQMLTSTPEGWLSTQEILTAQAEEKMRADKPTDRYLWLRRADRPDVRRPDEELAPLLNTKAVFEEIAPDTFMAKGQLRATGSGKGDDDDSAPPYDITVTMHLRGGVIRDYEVAIVGSRRVNPRSRIAMPVNDHRSVVITYVPVARVKVPDEVRDKLGTGRRKIR